MEYGLIGEKLVHSFSPEIHNLLDDYSYSLRPLKSEEVGAFMTAKNFKGINVTVPYKKTVIPYLDEISPLARKIGAVNTVVNRNGKLYGYNTDYYGFSFMLKFGEIEVKDRVVALLGTGGASNTVCAVLSDLGAKEIVIISRSGESNYEYLKTRKDVEIIVNATPVGTYPEVDGCAVDLDDFPSLIAVADLVYNPSVTELIFRANKRGIKSVNGLSMLVAQAKRASELFTDKTISDEVIKDIIFRIESKTKNVVLVGMPGSGKTTVGKILANETGREFIDTDAVFESEFLKSAGAYILENGESAFRKAESEVLKEACKQSGKVIATGGGVVTVEENFKYLKMNSNVVYLKRDLDKLATGGRPLSATKAKVENLYKIRKPLYEKASDFSVKVDGKAELQSDEIIEKLKLERI